MRNVTFFSSKDPIIGKQTGNLGQARWAHSIVPPAPLSFWWNDRCRLDACSGRWYLCQERMGEYHHHITGREGSLALAQWLGMCC